MPDKETILQDIDISEFYKSFIPSLKINGKAEATGLCPFHDDKHPSLSVNIQKGLYNCFACGESGDVFTFYQKINGVDFKTALEKMAEMQGIERADIKGKVVATYEYKDTEGKTLYTKERIEPARNGKPKEFIFKHRDGGKWVSGRGCDPVLYNLPQLNKSKYAAVVEGEGKVNLLKSWGIVATCLDSGANSPLKDDYLKSFEGKEKVVILPDNDAPGRSYALRIAEAIYGKVGSCLKIVDLQGLGEGKDIIDWTKIEGNTKEKLLEVVKTSPEWRPAEAQSEEITETVPVKNWPAPPAPEAFHGLAGEFVRTIEPHTEADPVALLIQFLVMVGNIIGKSAHFVAEADIHYSNLFTVLVGLTSKGRKGSSWGRIRTMFEGIDEDWGNNCIQSGLSSGEGLIWAIRDPIYKHEAVRDKGKPTGEVREVEIDHGVEDKRLLVFEPEFASALRVINRDGNTLSAIIRQAWDVGDLKTLTKNSPARATGGHISIIGHITRDELRRYLDRTESGNGFANRILWVCVQRSKTLPEGGSLQESDLAPLIERLSEAIKFARTAGKIKRDDAAREMWREVYPELSEGKPGLLGAIISRAEAQVMRLACLYALLDFSYFVRPEHLKTALALWEYCEASCQYIFGDSLGDPVADEILRELRKSPEGLTGTDISNLFGRNKNANQLSRALSLLMDNGLVRRGSKETKEGGRPAVLWTAI